MRRKWESFEDHILSLVVTDCKRKGYTYKEAFEIVSQRISRTMSACRSRWYRVIKEETEMILSVTQVPVKATAQKRSNVVDIATKQKITA